MRILLLLVLTSCGREAPIPSEPQLEKCKRYVDYDQREDWECP